VVLSELAWEEGTGPGSVRRSAAARGAVRAGFGGRDWAWVRCAALPPLVVLSELAWEEEVGRARCAPLSPYVVLSELAWEEGGGSRPVRASLAARGAVRAGLGRGR
jgi:hypothetical protein